MTASMKNRQSLPQNQNKPLSPEALEARRKYQRDYCKRNPEKKKQWQRNYWERVAERQEQRED